jgi:hypothetical protein
MNLLIVDYQLKRFFLPILSLILLIGSIPSLAQKNDTLYFLNGDRISGEIKSYQYGFLTYKTYGVSTVKVKFDKISTIFSRKNYEILFKDGTRLFGRFDTASVERNIKVIITNDTLLTPIIDIVEIVPIKNRFFKRISGSADLGYNYTKSTTISQFTFSSDFKYTQRKYFTTLGLNSNMSSQQEQKTTRKNDAGIALYYRLKNNWFGIGSISGEQNTELGLNFRVQTGVGIGNEVIHTNMNNLLFAVGVVINQEWSADTTGSRQNVDGMMLTTYRMFRFKDPSIDITTNLIAFPSFNVPDRWRINYDIKVKIEIVSDLYFGLSFYYNIDTKPPSTSSSTNDYGIVTSLGYTF